jgi:signal peptidase
MQPAISAGADEMSLTRTAPIGSAAGDTEQPQSAWRFFTGALSTIGVVLVCVLASLAIVLAVASRLSPRGQYVVFGHPVMTVLSGSMTPVIRTGDLIVDNPVTAAQARQLHVGQIISVRQTPYSHSVITHRIIAVEVHSGVVDYVTKGDANNAPDTTLRPSSDVIGVFRFDVPRGGYILAALHRPLVLGLLLASPVLWFLAGPFYRLARRMDTRTSEEPDKSGHPGNGDAP